MNEELPQRGVWRHFKGGLYIVLGVARDHETGELGVVYHGIVPYGEDDPSWNWRPLNGAAGWNTPVQLDLKDAEYAKLVQNNGLLVVDAGRGWFERFTFLYPINS